MIELLACHGQCLIGAEEIRRLLLERGVGSNASVYRILEQLCALGLVRRLIGRDGRAGYEIADPAHRHHHFVDDESGVVEPFVDAALDGAIAAAAERLGVRLSGHEIVLRGVRPA
ncbi:MAG TPA: transcriptional repressor [Conexibacter sp.]